MKIDENVILALFEDKWHDNLIECIDAATDNEDLDIFFDFENSVDIVELDHIENVSVENYDVEIGNFGIQIITGTLQVEAQFNGLTYWDKEYQHVEDILKTILIRFKFTITADEASIEGCEIA